MTLNIRQVLISDPVDPICSQILQDYGMNVTFARQWSKERLLQEIQVRFKSFLIIWCISFGFFVFELNFTTGFNWFLELWSIDCTLRDQSHGRSPCCRLKVAFGWSSWNRTWQCRHFSRYASGCPRHEVNKSFNLNLVKWIGEQVITRVGLKFGLKKKRSLMRAFSCAFHFFHNAAHPGEIRWAQPSTLALWSQLLVGKKILLRDLKIQIKYKLLMTGTYRRLVLH